MPQAPLAAFLRKRTSRRFSSVVAAYRDEVLDAAYRVLGDRDQAEDVSQEVFLKLLTVKWSPERIRSERGLVLSTAILAALTRARAEGRRLAREAEASARRADEGRIESRDDILDVRDAVLDLPEGLRAAVELRYFGGLTVKEVALTLGCAAETAKDRLARARELLRRRLGPALGALVAGGLLGESAAGWPASSPSAALRRALRRLSREGTALAAIAAGATGGVNLKVLGVVALVLLLAGAGWLHLARSGSARAGPTMLSVRAKDPSQAGAPPRAAADRHRGAAAAASGSPPPPGARPYRVVDPEERPIARVRVVFAKRFDAEEPVPDYLPEGELRAAAEEGVHWGRVEETDAAGGFEIPEFIARDPTFDTVQLLLSKEGYFSLERSLVSPLLQEKEPFTLSPAPERLLWVVGEDGEPVERYRLRLDLNFTASGDRIPPEHPFHQPATEEEVLAQGGVHRLRPSRNDWARGLTVEAPGYPPHEGRLFPYTEGGRDLAMRLRRERLLEGMVIDPDGLPVADAQVIACSELAPARLDLGSSGWECPGRYAGGAGAHRVRSGADGRFAVALLPGETWLAAICGRLVPAWVRAPAEHRGAVLAMQLGRGGRVRVACSGGDGSPLPGERIEIRLIGYGEDPGPLAEARRLESRLPVQISLAARTDGEGVALFGAVPGGSYSWFERLRQFAVREGETTELADRAPLPDPLEPAAATARVSGRITVDGRPLRTPRRWLEVMFIAGLAFPTDDDGRYAVDGVPVGVQTLQGPFGVWRAQLMQVEIPAGRREVEFSWNYPVARIRGRVLAAEDGRPVPGAEVSIYHREYWSEDPRRRGGVCGLETLRPDAGGAFRSPVPFSTGHYLLVAGAPGRETAIQEREIAQEAPQSIDFEFALPAARNRLRVSLWSRTRDLLPERAPEIEVCLLPRDAAGVPISLRFDEAARAWTWSGVPAGSYTLAVDAWRGAGRGLGFVYLPLEVPAGGGQIERTLEIPPAGKLAIAVRDASGRRFAAPFPRIALARLDGGPVLPPRLYRYPNGALDDQGLHELEVDRGGHLELDALPAGGYRIGASRRGFRAAETTVEVEEGRTAEVDLAIERLE